MEKWLGGERISADKDDDLEIRRLLAGLLGGAQRGIVGAARMAAPPLTAIYRRLLDEPAMEREREARRAAAARFYQGGQ